MQDRFADVETWAVVSAFAAASASPPTARELAEWQARHPAHAECLADFAEATRLRLEAEGARDGGDHDPDVDEDELAALVAASALLGRMLTGGDAEDE